MIEEDRRPAIAPKSQWTTNARAALIAGIILALGSIIYIIVAL